MSLRDFWINVRTGARFLSPRATVDSPKLDPGTIEQNLRATDLWLTPKSVEGFNEGDFPFLPPTERKTLAEQVNRFREVASQVPPDAPATKEQVEQAIPPFLKIIEMLEFHRYGDAEAYRLGKQIENSIQNHRPTMLAELRFNTGLDHTGDPGIWIWAIIDDEAVVDTVVRKTANEIHKLLNSTARSVAPERWPYINVRTVSEQAEIVGAAAQ